MSNWWLAVATAALQRRCAAAAAFAHGQVRHDVVKDPRRRAGSPGTRATPMRSGPKRPDGVRSLPKHLPPNHSQRTKVQSNAGAQFSADASPADDVIVDRARMHERVPHGDVRWYAPGCGEVELPSMIRCGRFGGIDRNDHGGLRGVGTLGIFPLVVVVSVATVSGPIVGQRGRRIRQPCRRAALHGNAAVGDMLQIDLPNYGSPD